MYVYSRDEGGGGRGGGGQNKKKKETRFHSSFFLLTKSHPRDRAGMRRTRAGVPFASGSVQPEEGLGLFLRLVASCVPTYHTYLHTHTRTHTQGIVPRPLTHTTNS